MNSLLSMIGSLLIGLVLGVFIVMFGDGRQIFNGISNVGLILGTVASSIIAMDAAINKNLECIRLAFLAIISTTLTLGISFYETDKNTLVMTLENIAPWVVIVFLVFLASVLLVKTFLRNNEIA